MVLSIFLDICWRQNEFLFVATGLKMSDWWHDCFFCTLWKEHATFSYHSVQPCAEFLFGVTQLLQAQKHHVELLCVSESLTLLPQQMTACGTTFSTTDLQYSTVFPETLLNILISSPVCFTAEELHRISELCSVEQNKANAVLISSWAADFSTISLQTLLCLWGSQTSRQQVLFFFWETLVLQCQPGCVE